MFIHTYIFIWDSRVVRLFNYNDYLSLHCSINAYYQSFFEKKNGNLFKNTTLKYLIAEHARLTFFKIFSTLLALIRSCSLNYFHWFFHPALLLHPAHQGRRNLMCKVRICTPNIWSTSKENPGFAQPLFWPYVIVCAPNLQQIPPPPAAHYSL